MDGLGKTIESAISNKIDKVEHAIEKYLVLRTTGLADLGWTFRMVFYVFCIVFIGIFIACYIYIKIGNLTTANTLFVVNTICIFVANFIYCFFLPLGKHEYNDPQPPYHKHEKNLSMPYDIIGTIANDGRSLLFKIILSSNIFYKYSFFPFLPLIILYSIFFIIIFSSSNIPGKYHNIIALIIIISSSVLFILTLICGGLYKIQDIESARLLGLTIFITILLGRIILSAIGITLAISLTSQIILNSNINCSLHNISSVVDNVYSKLRNYTANSDFSGNVVMETPDKFRVGICDNSLSITTTGDVIITILFIICILYYIVAIIALYYKNYDIFKEFFGQSVLAGTIVKYLSIIRFQMLSSDKDNKRSASSFPGSSRRGSTTSGRPPIRQQTRAAPRRVRASIVGTRRAKVVPVTDGTFMTNSL